MATKRVGGLALVGAAVMVVMGMAHHPTGLQSGVGQIVHGAMILALIVTAFGFAAFVADREISGAAMLAGSIAFAVAVFAEVGAATISGFIVPAVATSGEPIGRDIYQLTWAANQSLAWLGVMATGAAFVLWSAHLLRGDDRWAKAVGMLGIAAGIVPAILLFSGTLRMNVSGALIVYSVQALWGALVGLRMLAEARADGQAG